MKEGKDALTEAIAEMGKEMPIMVEVLLDERNDWMTYQLQRCAATDFSAGSSGGTLRAGEPLDREDGEPPPQPQVMLAVVGAGHVPGIKERWPAVCAAGGASAAQLQALFEVPPPSPYARAQKVLVLTSLGLVAVGGCAVVLWLGRRAPAAGRQAVAMVQTALEK